MFFFAIHGCLEALGFGSMVRDEQNELRMTIFALNDEYQREKPSGLGVGGFLFSAPD